jgi:hypothetical protein
MKYKLIIMLMVVLTAKGNICGPFNDFTFSSFAIVDRTIQKDSPLELKPDDKYTSYQSLEINTISSGVITYTLISNEKSDEMEITSKEESSPYFHHELIDKNDGSCVLTYITIESNMPVGRQLTFKPCLQKCQNELENELSKNKACAYDEYLRFKIPMISDITEVPSKQLESGFRTTKPVKAITLERSKSKNTYRKKAFRSKSSRKTVLETMFYDEPVDLETVNETELAGQETPFNPQSDNNKPLIEIIFNTHSKTFELNDQKKIILNYFDIELNPELAITINNGRFTTTTGSCSILFNMIQSLLMQDWKSNNTFDFVNLQVAETGKRTISSTWDISGEITITSPNDIVLKPKSTSNNKLNSKLPGLAQQFILATYEDLNDIFTRQEGDPYLSLSLTTESDLSTSYYMDVNFKTKQRLGKVKELFQFYSSCSDIASLYYYKQVNLQSKEESVESGKLKFTYLKGIVEEYSNGKKVRVIRLYDMTLNPEKKEQWLYIKGEDITYEHDNVDKSKEKYIVNYKENITSKQRAKTLNPTSLIINKKYLVKISNNKFCYDYLIKNIKLYVEEEFVKLAGEGIYYFWEPSEGSEALKSIGVGVVDGEKMIFKKGKTDISVPLNSLSFNNNVVSGQLKKGNFHDFHLSNCVACLNILLGKTTSKNKLTKGINTSQRTGKKTRREKLGI